MNIGTTITKHLIGKPDILGLSLTVKDISIEEHTDRLIYSLRSNHTESKLNNLLDRLSLYDDSSSMCVGLIWYTDGSWSEIDWSLYTMTISYYNIPKIPNNLK